MTFKHSVPRGRSQVLFNYLPGALIDFPTAEVVTKVVAIGSKELVELKSKKRIIDRIYLIIKSNKYSSVDEAFPEKADPSIFMLGEPKYVNCEIYPLVFSSRRDNRVHFFNSIEELENFIETRWNRSDKLIQRDLVFITKDGDLDRLHPTLNARNRDLKLVKVGETQAGLHWVDANTGEDLGQIYHIIRGKRINVATPVRAKITYLPQTMTLVNIRDYIEVESETDKEKFAFLILAKYLNMLDSVNLRISQCMQELPYAKNFQSDDKVRKMVSILGIKMDDLPEETKQKLFKEIEDTSVGGRIASAANSAKSKISYSILENIYDNIYEYIETAESKNRVTIEYAINSHEGPEKSKFAMFKRKLNIIGIKTAIYVEDVPLINVAYGYTRGSFDTKETKLRAFSSDMFDKDRIPIYVNLVATEGLLLEFDRAAILKWLKRNNVINDELPKTEEEEKLWFLRNVNPNLITTFGGAAEEGITKEVFHLIHTVSHSLIKEIPELCGIGLDSIGELIFPNIPAILIYSKESGEFRIGALKDLFENKIYPWVDRTAKSITKCVYDPVCIHSTGACHSCLFINEVSCAFFNQELSRHYLMGKYLGKPANGFWETAISELYESDQE